MLTKNMLIQWLPDEEGNGGKAERILYIDSTGEHVVTIRIEDAAGKRDEHAFPMWKSREEIEDGCSTNRARVLHNDPYGPPSLPEDKVSVASARLRAEAWTAIHPLIADEHSSPVLAMFDPAERGKLIAQAAKRAKRSKRLIYRDLRRYWQGGQTMNAVMPRLYKRGGRNKTRSDSAHKVGRKSRQFVAVMARKDLGEAVTDKEIGQAEGSKLTSHIVTLMERGIKLFYDKSSPRPSQRKAYDLMNAALFRSHYEISKDGIAIPILLPAHQRPSLRQFRWQIEKTRYIRGARRKRMGEREYALRGRPMTGDRTMLARGPGSLWYIDATVADIYLVSSLDRKRIIGRPVLYVVIDAFSQMIVGFAVTLEGPSWVGAMLALENATTDKVDFCDRYKVAIDEGEWPVAYLPEELYADRGELISPAADNLVSMLNVRIGNSAPYRADWKAEVEREFKLLNDETIHWLPGATYKARVRGERDYRLDACLTLNEFRQIIVRCVLHHNHCYELPKYPTGADLVAADIEPYPIELWEWGIRNRAGLLHTASRNKIRMALLPSGMATVREDGIRFQGLDYSCPRAAAEGWFERAREQGRWSIAVAYDPRLPGKLYVQPTGADMGAKRGGDGGYDEIEDLTLLSRHSMYLGCDLHEVIDLEAIRAARRALRSPKRDQDRVALAAEIASVTGPAQEATEAATAGMTKNARTAGIRDNRQEERNLERAEEAWRLGDGDAQATGHASSPTENKTSVVDSDDAGVSARDARRLDMLRKRRAERQG